MTDRLTIAGVAYGVTWDAGHCLLHKPNGAVYEVTTGDRPTCECADFLHRHAGLPTAGCKHIRAVRAVLTDAGPLPIVVAR